MRLKALEVPFELSCHGAGAARLADALRSAWDWCLDPDADPTTAADSGAGLVGGVSGEVQRVSLLLADAADELMQHDGEHDLFGLDLATLLDRLSPLVTRLAVTERAGTLMMFHACAVADPATGAAVVLFGPSGAGKTTVARALCQDYAYLTDEATGVHDDGSVLGYPKPLSIIATPGDLVKEQVSPGELGLRPPADGTSPLLAGLVQLRRDPLHRGDPVVERLETVDALAELVAQTSYSRQLKRPLHRLAALTQRVGGVRSVDYAEAEQLHDVVAELLRDAS